MKIPRIGVSACFFHADPKRAIFKGKTLQYLEQSMAHWLMSEPALVYMIPSPAEDSPVTLADLARELDGLVLQGGSDVSPKSYGETPLKPEWSGDYIRDQYEIALVHEFKAQKKPVLGICRGLQLLNVAYGGTLYQDIETQVQGAHNHRNWEIYDQNFHEIQIVNGSRLQKLYDGAKSGKINTVHHQAIKELGKGLAVEAKSSDGIIEAIRATGGESVFGVQWHPEFHDPSDSRLLAAKPILRDFLKEVSHA